MPKKIIIQCDFDGTLTNEDISFKILQQYATCDWQAELQRYMAGEISVGQFNRNVFQSVKEDRPTLIKFIKKVAETRPGATAFFDFCANNNLELQIVSNGLDLYIKQILGDLGYTQLPIYAAVTEFGHDGLYSAYYDAYGQETLVDYKAGYVQYFKERAGEVVYIGNGVSDFAPAQMCHYVFATDSLSHLCMQHQVPYTHFDNFDTVIDGLKQRYNL